jgi:uncharacterized protein
MKKILLFEFILVITCHSAFSQPPENPNSKQVRQIFPAKKLKKNYQFNFNDAFSEHFVRTSDGILISAIIFHSRIEPRGVILYLHGNTGGMEKWGKLAPFYTSLGYDLFMFDYRGYGKSQGNIKNEIQLYSDIETVYDSVRQLYPEKNIVVMGYSIGTGPAAMLASNNHPGKLILDAPYYSLLDAVQKLYPKATSSDLAFGLETFIFMPKIACPVVIFHGDADSEFYYGGSLKLKGLFKRGDTLITLKGQDHADFEKNIDYLTALRSVLP